MNIDNYRAMVAEEAKQAEQEQQQVASQVEQTTDVATTQTNEAPGTIETIETTQAVDTQVEQVTPTLPDVIEIDGKPVPVEELKNGYLRQSDYTKKTQELARQREQQAIADAYFQAINSRPELAQAVAQQFNLPFVDPAQSELIETRNRLQDIELQQTVNSLIAKYPDFEAREVMQFAVDNKVENLEHAYTLLSHQKGSNVQADPVVDEVETPGAIDVEALTKQIRQDVLKELQSNVDTQSIIQTNGSGSAIVDNTPTLSEQEMKVARNLRMSPEEYAKWRDKK